MDFFQICSQVKYTNDDFVKLMNLIYDENDLNKMAGMVGFRRLMSTKYQPTQHIIDANLLPTFLGYLERKDVPRFQFEALWILTNVASGHEDYCQALLNKGAIPLFIQLCMDPENTIEVKNQAIWALGNIGGDEAFRNTLIAADTVKVICSLMLQADPDSQFLRNCIWTVANLARGHPPLSLDEIQQVLPIANQILNTCQMTEVLTDTLWAISYITDIGKDIIPFVIETGVTERVVSLMQHDSVGTAIPALRTIGNFVTGTDEETDFVVKQGALEKLAILMNHQDQLVRKETCWTISNLCASSFQHIKQIIELGIIDKLIELSQTDSIDVQRECIWSLSNATALRNVDIQRVLVEKGIIQCLSTWLKKNDSKSLVVILEALVNILIVGQQN